jgi:C-terminal processing protease CtpA/Prc
LSVRKTPPLGVVQNYGAGQAMYKRTLAATGHAIRLMLSLTMCSQLTGAAVADQLQNEQTDTSAAATMRDTSVSVNAGDASHSKVPLNGRVETKEEFIDQLPAFRGAIQKLIAREKLTSDEYRSLGIGVLGIHAERNLFSNRAEITALIPGCPAANAGIRVGDWEIVKNDPESQTDSHGLSQFTCGLAGKLVDLTIRRRGHTLQFHLVRMNIEDIPDDRVRRAYEHQVNRMRSKLVRAYPQLDPKVLDH